MPKSKKEREVENGRESEREGVKCRKMEYAMPRPSNHLIDEFAIKKAKDCKSNFTWKNMQIFPSRLMRDV